MDELEAPVVDDFVPSQGSTPYVPVIVYGPPVDVTPPEPVLTPFVPIVTIQSPGIPYVAPVVPEPVIATVIGDPVVGAYEDARINNFAADLATHTSTNESFYALAQDGGSSTDWYNFPTQSGSVLFEPVGGGPVKLLTGTGQVMAYDGQSLMPSTWYLNPSLNGTIVMDNTQPAPAPVPAQGTLYASANNLFYNAQSLMPSTWYLNPALNGEILLDDASGTQLLHSIDANLYYNNELLAKANDIQDIADWSLYPALASVEMDGNSITNAGSVAATGTITAGNFSTIGNLSVAGITATGTVTAGNFSTIGNLSVAGITATGTVTAGNFSTVGNLSVAGITATGNISADTLSVGGITATGGINAGISSIICGGISTNGVAPVTSNSITTSQVLFDICGGTLTSPDGTVLTFNSQAITTGQGGDASNWANYPAITTVTGLGNAPLQIQPGAGQQLNISAPDNSINQSTGGSYNVTVDKGVNVLAGANVNVTAQNGGGGNIQLNAEPGYQLGPQQVGFGQIQLNAYGSSNQLLGLGGKIDITAYSGGVGEYGSATSRVSLSAATLALSAGAAPTLPATAGSVNLFGQDIISIVAAPIPPILPQFPESVYIYGLGVPFVSGGVRLESPNGIQLAGNSDLYATDIYPYTSLGLNLKGRASVPGPAADVTIADCASIDMRSAATIGGVTTLTMAGTGAINGVKTITATTGNLSIQGSGVITPYLVSMANVNTVAFEPAGTGGTGAITGVQTINGVAYPPPVGDVADWSTFPAIQNVAMGAFKVTNLAAGTVGTDGVNFTQLTFRDSTEFYVSSQGNDANNGSILSPKLTIQAAITAAELISSAAFVCVINVASGHYTENLTFNKGYVILNGSLQSQTGNEVCEITGSISIACVGANDVFNRQVTFQGFNITCGAAQSVTDTSTSSHTVTFQDCKMFIDSVFFTSTSTAADMRFYLTNVEVSQTNAAFTGAVITTNLGLAEFERLDLNLIGNCIGLTVGGTSTLNRCSLSTFDANNVAAILRPLVNISSSSTSAHSLGNVAFAFNNAAAKTNTNALFIASSINTALIMLNCVFTLAGTSNSTNNCVGYNGTGSPTIAGINNTSLNVNVALPQTTSVQSGITQIQYTNIQPPGLASYSSSVDQAISVVGLPQALTFNTTQFNQGTTLLASSRIYANAQGNYVLTYVIQLLNGGIITNTATSFLKKNGTTIANTGLQWILAPADSLAVTGENIVSLNAGDYVEVFFNGSGLVISANATAAAGALPAVPSVIFNIKQIR